MVFYEARAKLTPDYKDSVKGIENGGVRVVDVNARNCIPVAGPVDRVEILWVKLLSELEDKVVDRGLVLPGVEI